VSAHDELDAHRLIAAFADELARGGVTDVCTSPGSRSTPLVLALAREPRLRAHSHVDERASGFFALGMAKASGRPAAVTCTSGTAAAELLPAVIEASEANVPLLILTADRPPELRGVGAGQTIDQVKVYGDAVRWFFEVGNHDVSPESGRWVRALACRALAAAMGPRPGPVHLNFPLREPLVAPARVEPLTEGRPGGRPWVAFAGSPALTDHLAEPRRGIVVAGRDDRGLAPAVPALAAACRDPLLAAPLPSARPGPAAIAHYDLLLRDAAFAADHAPEVVIRVGDLPTSKPLRSWLAGLADARQIAVAPHGPWQDPASVVELVLRAEPRALEPAPAADPAWLERWRAADARAADAIARELGDGLCEPNVARALAAALPPEATVFVAASMPVRDLESFWPARDGGPRVLANRGANGIDGTLSTAFGVAAASPGPVVALLGDVAFAHDLSALLAASRLDIGLTIVLLDNGGGAIFDHLPVAAAVDAYEQHVATPTGLDARRAAALYGLAYTAPASLDELRDALAHPGSSTLIHVRTERPAELALHRRVGAATSRALAGAPPA
jgi:2-succinyl-5-enolpyruvyl-6-hydroxy-3-cyclohexene-1-carboxylate synthase